MTNLPLILFAIAGVFIALCVVAALFQAGFEALLAWANW